jgi:hypothetical protein
VLTRVFSSIFLFKKLIFFNLSLELYVFSLSIMWGILSHILVKLIQNLLLSRYIFFMLNKFNPHDIMCEKKN